MRKLLFLFSLALMLGILGQSRLAAQDITILGGSKNPAIPTSICQCDTLGDAGGQGRSEIKYDLAGNFSATTDFFYELAQGTNFPAATSLELLELTRPNNVTTPPVDSFSTGVKWADLVIPCNAPLGPAAFRVRNSNGEVSDTIYFIINRVPSKPVLDSIQFGYPNPYTTGVDDWGFCEGDSIILYAQTQFGATYQWNDNGAPIAGATDSFYVAKAGGRFSVTVDLGACARTSKDTVVNSFLPLTDITMVTSPTVSYQIDNPSPGNVTPDDSTLFCENRFVVLEGPAPAAATNLTYSYQWLTDSIDQFGDTTFYMLDPGDTNRQITLDTAGRFYVVTYDGFCTDTSAAYYLFEDTIPDPAIQYQNFQFGLPTTPQTATEICMKDSILLSVPLSITDTLEFQWQRYNTSTNMWINMPPNLDEPKYDGQKYTIQIDTSLKPIQPLSFYRLQIWTLTPYDYRRVCAYTTDSVVVRWYPEDSITYDMTNPAVTQVGRDSINLCETDSVDLIAPATPNSLINRGYFYQYQWLRDSLDTAIGGFVKVVLPGETQRRLNVNESGRYYVRINDGICVDTIRRFRVFVDSLPSTTITETQYPGQTSTPDRNLCLTDSVMLSATDTVLGLRGWSYQWQVNVGGGWTNSLNDTLPWLSVDRSFRPAGVDTVLFRLAIQYENQFGLTTCPDTTDSINVQFFDPPTVSFFPGDSIGLCAGDSVLVIAQGTSLSYTWADGTLGSQRYISTPGTYTVTGRGVNNCTTVRDIVIYNIQPQANAGSNITITSGETATLTGSGGSDYRWYASQPIEWSDFLSRSVDVSYTLPDGVTSDTITIYMVATNDQGCSDLDSLLLIVIAEGDDDLNLISRAYNFFTPNNDGLNDIWDISEITRGSQCRIDILNRWGSTVYSDETFNGTWDGNDSGGNPLPDGTYYYILSCDGEVILKNAVTLIRNQ